MTARSRLLDPRVWLGLAVTAFFLWLALRDAPFAEVGRVLARADWPLLLGLSVPSYVWVVYVRARRWAHLTAPLGSVGTGPLFRGVAVGFMVNNVLPLRVGEVARVWYLARETRLDFAPILGTVILERIIDTLTVVLLAAIAVAWWGLGDEGWVGQGALVILLPVLGLAAFLTTLLVAPDRVVGLVTWLLKPLPARAGELAEGLLRRIGDGLAALRSGYHLFWVSVDSLMIWLVGSTLPLLAGLWSLGIDLGDAADTLVASWTLLVAVALGVALPSAPGFFGPYHFAAKVALQRFGVPAETAVAVGTLVHAVFWVTLTGLGLVVLRMRRTSLAELDAATSEPEPPAAGKADPSAGR